MSFRIRTTDCDSLDKLLGKVRAIFNAGRVDEIQKIKTFIEATYVQCFPGASSDVVQ